MTGWMGEANWTVGAFSHLEVTYLTMLPYPMSQHTGVTVLPPQSQSQHKRGQSLPDKPQPALGLQGRDSCSQDVSWPTFSLAVFSHPTTSCFSQRLDSGLLGYSLKRTDFQKGFNTQNPDESRCLNCAI